MSKILIVEDEVAIADLEKDYLELSGFEVEIETSGDIGLSRALTEEFDMFILDLMLPGLNGEDVLTCIRQKQLSREIPVIVLSARADVDGKVNLLLDGAVDYVTKPFDTRELLARIAVQLRLHAFTDTPSLMTFGGLTLDVRTRSVSLEGHPVHLTRTEYAILKLLLQNPAQVMTKSLLLDRICEDTPDCTEVSLKMHISNLRKKFRDINGKDYIEAVWGIGFRLKE